MNKLEERSWCEVLYCNRWPEVPTVKEVLKDSSFTTAELTIPADECVSWPEALEFFSAENRVGMPRPMAMYDALHICKRVKNSIGEFSFGAATHLVVPVKVHRKFEEHARQILVFHQCAFVELKQPFQKSFRYDLTQLP